MILAAGLGTRLMPFTAETPKALVEVNGIPLLELAIRKMSAEGFEEIIVNIHHHGQKILDFLNHLKFPGAKIAISDETDLLLDTGGAILKARWFLDGDQPFVVYNVDVITSLNLKKIYKAHILNGGLATLAVSNRSSGRYLLFNQLNRLCGWKDVTTDHVLWSSKPDPGAKALAFSGIHVISPALFDLLNDIGRFSVIEAYIRLAASEGIYAFDHSDEVWFDLGKADQVDVISSYLKDHPEINPR